MENGSFGGRNGEQEPMMNPCSLLVASAGCIVSTFIKASISSGTGDALVNVGD